jgi:GH15 family glucan-1,4-alpha-glucosidase
MGSFVQSYGAKELDASLLLIPSLGFLPPDDRRVRGTIAAVERFLMADGLVLRYNTTATEDGLPPGEGAFLACSFWLADAYVLVGRTDDARQLFERLLSLRNDVGLLSEEYDPRARRMLGNFPQAFSHVGLVNTAHNLSRVSKPAEQRATR